MISHLLASLVEDVSYNYVTLRNVHVPQGKSVQIDDVVGVVLAGIVVHIKMHSLDPDLRIDVESPRFVASVNVWSLVDAGIAFPGPLGVYVSKYDPDEMECAVVVAPPIPIYVDRAKVSVFSGAGCNIVYYARSGYSVNPQSVVGLVSLVADVLARRAVPEVPAREVDVKRRVAFRLDPEATRR